MTATIAIGEAPKVKDRRPTMPGAARAAALLRTHCKIEPFVHQADGLACMLERFERFGSFGLLHDMGCGKTLTMLGGFLSACEEGRASSMLVVCPSSVMGAWQKECEGILARGGVEIDVCALDHVQVKRRKRDLAEWLARRRMSAITGEENAPGIVVINYECTWRMEKELREAGFDIDVCDESQRIKGAGAKQSLAMFRIGKSPSQVYLDAMKGAAQLAGRMPIRTAPLRCIMTGTPVPEGALDWYGQFRFLDYTVFGTSNDDFKAKYAREIDCGSFRKVVVNKHMLPELERIVMERVHRVSKWQAVDLPPQLHNPISFELSSKQRRIYDDLVRDSVAMVDSTYAQFGEQLMQSGFDADMDWTDEREIIGDNVLTRMLRLQQICGGYMQVMHEAAVEPCHVVGGKIINPKLSVLADLMEDLRDNGKKLVIFHRFTHEGLAIQELARRISGKNTPVSVINGSVKTSDRKGQVAQFQEGDASFFVGQIQACSEGITLTAASDGAFYSLPFASAVFMQALARYHRIGQEHNVTHHMLLAANTIDEAIFHSQMQKQDAQIEHVDNGWQRHMSGLLTPKPVAHQWHDDAVVAA